jgi:ankyrin repeat protein
MLYLLTEMGMSVNELDYEGNAPLHLAVRNRHMTSVKFLIALGAAINVVD